MRAGHPDSENTTGSQSKAAHRQYTKDQGSTDILMMMFQFAAGSCAVQITLAVHSVPEAKTQARPLKATGVVFGSSAVLLKLLWMP